MGTIDSSEILVTQLSQVETKGGNIFHAMKKTDAGYSGFGEAYFSWISFGAIKAWKRHNKMTMNLIVPIGLVRFVFNPGNANSYEEFKVEEAGLGRYVRITVPPGIWFGFQGLHSPQSLVLNISSTVHDPNEVERLDLSEINFPWKKI